MSTSPIRRWTIVGAIVLFLAASLVLRRTHSVDLEYEVEANYLDVVAGTFRLEIRTIIPNKIIARYAIESF